MPASNRKESKPPGCNTLTPGFHFGAANGVGIENAMNTLALGAGAGVVIVVANGTAPTLVIGRS